MRELTILLQECQDELDATRALLKTKEQTIDAMKEELEALRPDNHQRRYQLMCCKCRSYLDSIILV